MHTFLLDFKLIRLYFLVQSLLILTKNDNLLRHFKSRNTESILKFINHRFQLMVALLLHDVFNNKEQ